MGYVTKQNEVEVVFWSGNNIEDVMRLCNEKYNVEKSTLDDEALMIKRNLNSNIYVALGNYIVKDIIGKNQFLQTERVWKNF